MDDRRRWWWLWRRRWWRRRWWWRRRRWRRRSWSVRGRWWRRRRRWRSLDPLFRRRALGRHARHGVVPGSWVLAAPAARVLARSCPRSLVLVSRRRPLRALARSRSAGLAGRGHRGAVGDRNRCRSAPELGGSSPDHTGASRVLALVDDRLDTGKLDDDLLRSLGQADRGPVDDRWQRNREPARRQGRYRHENERSQEDELVPAPHRLRGHRDGPHVQGRGLLPQHQSQLAPRGSFRSPPFWGCPAVSAPGRLPPRAPARSTRPPPRARPGRMT